LISVPPRRWGALLRATPISVGAGAFLLTGLAAYYAWTITVHPEAAAVGTTTPQTIVFVFYELLGFVGLGPGRNTLRNEGAAALKPFLPVLICFAGAVAFVAWLGIREILDRLGRRQFWRLALVALTPLLALIGIGMASHFRLLGRHVTPMLPLILLLLSFGVARAIRSGKGPRVIAAAFCLLWLGSSFSIRWADRQRKDEYRGAAAIARAAIQRGETVWWNADIWGARYYGLPVDDGAVQNFYPLINASTQQVQNLPLPNVIIVSKPDSHDVAHGVALYLRENRYPVTERLPAFVVYRRSEVP
jgi:hypothetical protein